MARKRRFWKRHQGKVDANRLIFVDETWTKTNMTPIRGWCPRGQRLLAKVPHGRWKTLTFIAGLRADGICAPCVLDRPINGRSFLAWVEQCLAPTLRAGDIVVLDNLGSHKGQAVREAIRNASADCFFYRLTALTSTPSNRSSPSSKHCSAKPPPEASKRHGGVSETSSTPSHHKNAKTTSETQVTRQHENIVL